MYNNHNAIQTHRNKLIEITSNNVKKIFNKIDKTEKSLWELRQKIKEQPSDFMLEVFYYLEQLIRINKTKVQNNDKD